MATRKVSGTKGSKKKGAGKKSSKSPAKKSASKKTAARAGIAAAPSIPFPNLECFRKCNEKFNECLRKGVNRETCLKRFARCAARCFGGGIFEQGGDEE